MNNQIDPNNIDKNTDQSRVFDDNGNRIENNNTEFSNNLTNYYNNVNNNDIKDKTLSKEEKTEVVNGLFDKIKNSILLFFNSKKVGNDEEYLKRCKNTSSVSIFFLLIVVLDFLINKTDDPLNLIVNIGCLVVLALAIVSLRTGKKNGVMFGLAGGVLMLLSFNIIRMIFGVIYILGMLFLMNCREEKTDNSEKK